MSVVIIGAGHAGTTAATALRKLDKDIKISLVSKEGSPPYQRPPLSKKTIFSVTQNYDLILGKDFYNKNNIQLNLNSAVEKINPTQSHVRLNSNKIIVKKGLLKDKIKNFYYPYFFNRQKKLPFVTGKIALSKNNLIYSKIQKKITNYYSDRFSHLLR